MARGKVVPKARVCVWGEVVLNLETLVFTHLTSAAPQIGLFHDDTTELALLQMPGPVAVPVGSPVPVVHPGALALLYGPPRSGKSCWLNRQREASVLWIEVHDREHVRRLLLSGTEPTPYLVYTTTEANADKAYAAACVAFQDVVDEHPTELRTYRKDFPVHSEPILESVRGLARVGCDPVVRARCIERAQYLRSAS